MARKAMPANQILDRLEQRLPIGVSMFREVEVADPSYMDQVNRIVEERNRIWKEIGVREAKAWQARQKWPNHGRRIDAVTIESGRVTAYEVKRTLQDFRNDTPAKRFPWMHYSNLFYYVTPEGLLKETAIPDGCGLIEVSETHVVVRVVAPRRDCAPLPEWLQALGGNCAED